jgi:ATPase subunit of ABC transporter with duplicated ATPase domains
MQESLDRKKAHMEASIEQNLRMAQKQKDDKRLKQVASRKTKLDERLGYERNAKGHRFKLNRDRVGWHDSVRGEVEGVEDEKTQSRLKFNILAPELPRFNGPLLVVDELKFERATGKDVAFRLQNITFSVDAGQRLALLGPNGQGKSTLLNLIADAWTPTAGTIQRRTSRIGYFQQHIVVELGKDSRSALERLCAIYPGEKQAYLWKHLGAFGLGAQQLATKTPLSSLSGEHEIDFISCFISFRCLFNDDRRSTCRIRICGVDFWHAVALASR